MLYAEGNFKFIKLSWEWKNTTALKMFSLRKFVPSGQQNSIPIREWKASSRGTLICIVCSKYYKTSFAPEKDMSSVIWVLELRRQQGRVICLIPCHESICGLASQLQHLWGARGAGSNCNVRIKYRCLEVVFAI